MITADVEQQSGTAWITVVSTSPEVASVSVTPSDTTLVIGDNARLTAIALDATGVAVLGQSFEWSSSDPFVASVQDGSVSGMSIGSTTISATASGTTGSATVNVTAPPPGSVPAFPGAEGHGALALNDCDRDNLEVLTVTNLDADGPGSLRDAVERASPDRLSIVIFRTGGTIRLNGALAISRGCLYIAGQTAPGDGIQLDGKPGTVLRLTRYSGPRDIVVRYLRLRSGKGVPGAGDVVSIESGHNIVFDHISAQWSNDEVFSIHTVDFANGGTDAADITLQRSIIAEGLREHSTGSLVVFNPGVEPPIEKISIHHNLYAHNSHRNPRIGATTDVQITNNIVYNWRNRVGSVRNGAWVDYLNNYFKAGPWNPSGNRILEQDPGLLSSLYLLGNVAYPKQVNATDDQRNLVTYNNSMGYADVPAEIFRFYRQTDPSVQVTLETAVEAYASVLNDVGANKRLDCEGNWVDVNDRVDTQIIRDVLEGTGPSSDSENDHEDDYGGLPILQTGTACADSDGDGMPDAFELRYNLDPENASDAAQDLDADGYKNLEEYLNGTRPR